MSSKFRLHYAPDNASLCVRLALEELNLPYETQLVDRAKGEQKSAAFLVLNPNGLIPALETPQGPMFETGAILIWLADTYGTMLPDHRAPERLYAVQWMMWLANTLHPTLRMMFYPEQYTTGPIKHVRDQAGVRLRTHLDLLSASTTTPWLEDGRLSAHACYLGPMLRWSALYGGGADWFKLTQWPRLSAFAQTIETSDVVKRVAEAEGLGPLPFSSPSPCNPPEGSAL